MNKLLCERPRGGWRLKTHRASRHSRDWESEPTRGRMPGKVRSSKWLNENLQPLQRFLQSNVGRPWDKVYSELRANLRVRKAIDLHILQHLDRMVALDVRYEGKVPMVADRDGWRAIRGTRWEALYVCPRTGLLRDHRRARKVTSRDD